MLVGMKDDVETITLYLTVKLTMPSEPPGPDTWICKAKRLLGGRYVAALSAITALSVGGPVDVEVLSFETPGAGKPRRPGFNPPVAR